MKNNIENHSRALTSTQNGLHHNETQLQAVRYTQDDFADEISMKEFHGFLETWFDYITLKNTSKGAIVDKTTFVPREEKWRKGVCHFCVIMFEARIPASLKHIN